MYIICCLLRYIRINTNVDVKNVKKIFVNRIFYLYEI